MLMIIVVLFAGGMYLVVAGAFSALGEKPKSSFGLPLDAGGSEYKLVSSRSEALRNLSTVINKPFMGSAYFNNIQQKLEFMRYAFGALEFILIKEFALIVAGMLGAMLFSPMMGIIAALVGFVLPDMLLAAKVSAKKDAMVRVFPETVDLLDLCIGAGLDFLSAIRWVIEKSNPNPFLEQLSVLINEVRVGKSRTDALRDLADRVKIPDINSFTRAIVQAERMGVSIEEALRNLSEDTREMRFQQGERFAIKASLKILIPLLFFILPVVLIVVAGPVIIQFMQGGLFGVGGASGG